MRPLQVRLLADQLVAQIRIDVTWAEIVLSDQRFPVVADGPKMNLREISIVHSDRWPRIIPDPLDRYVDFFRFNCLYQVVTELAADTVGKRFPALLSQLVGVNQVAASPCSTWA